MPTVQRVFTRLGWPRDVSALAAVISAFTLLLVILVGFLLQWHLQQVSAGRTEVRLTLMGLQSSEMVLQDVINAETGQRGFLLTGDRRYLVPYKAATQQIWADFDRAELDAPTDEALAALEQARPLLERKFAELAKTIALRPHSFTEALAVVRTDVGQELTEQIRGRFDGLEKAEKTRLDQYLTRLAWRAETVTSVALACGALALVTATAAILSIVRRRDTRVLAEQNRHLEQQVHARTADLERANAELEAFAATISHDLRAPVRATGGYALALQEDLGPHLSDEQQMFLRRITSMTERMDSLIDDILAFSRLAHVRPQFVSVSLDRVVEDAVDLLRPQIMAAGADVAVAHPMPPVRGDAAALGDVLSNLIANALKFVRPGERPRVRIRAEQRDGMVRVWVADEGIGIAPSDQERIFKPFERLHGREAYAGTGVGLAIVRRMMETLGGGSGVVSAVGKGSQFWIDVPAWKGEEG